MTGGTVQSLFDKLKQADGEDSEGCGQPGARPASYIKMLVELEVGFSPVLLALQE